MNAWLRPATPLVVACLCIALGFGLSSCARKDREAPPPQSTPATAEPVQTAVPAPATPHWDYAEHGPAAWGALCPEFAMCASGKQQSPIDIVGAQSGTLPELQATYRPTALRVVHHVHVADGINNGHTVQVNCPGEDTLIAGTEKFALLQYHFHAPSEHTLAGKHFPMEMHMVHKSAAGTYAAVGVFIQEGAHNAAFDPVWKNLPVEKGVETHYPGLTVSTDDLLPRDRKSYRYDGSLTTPPCTEGVMWFVLATPVQLSKDQIAAFTGIISVNNRPVQPLNERVITSDLVGDMSVR